MSIVADHYATADACRRVQAALVEAGLDPARLGWADLAPLDQFHVRGRVASEDLAARLAPSAGAAVLDIGCGLGGPARMLAATFGCRVTGIDLSAGFVAVANMLSRLTGLADRVTCLQADAIDLPFGDATFDAVWSEHVAMNIADRTRLYAGMRRVLKPGGRLAIYDVVAGGTGGLIFPVPWARDAAISFLLDPAAMRDALETAGFAIEDWHDATAEGIAWFDRQAMRQAAPTRLGLAVLMGTDFPARAANIGRNLREGRAGLVQAVLRAV
jgi:SAM-dependent methyltransferase